MHFTLLIVFVFFILHSSFYIYLVASGSKWSLKLVRKIIFIILNDNFKYNFKRSDPNPFKSFKSLILLPSPFGEGSGGEAFFILLPSGRTGGGFLQSNKNGACRKLRQAPSHIKNFYLNSLNLYEFKQFMTRQQQSAYDFRVLSYAIAKRYLNCWITYTFLNLVAN